MMETIKTYLKYEKANDVYFIRAKLKYKVNISLSRRRTSASLT